MNTSPPDTSSSFLLISPKESTHSRSQTEPLVASPEKSSPESRWSVDGSPRQFACTSERDTSVSPSKSQKREKRSTTLTSGSPPKTLSRKNSGLLKSPSIPTFHPEQDPTESRSTPSVSAPEVLLTAPSTPLLRTSSNTPNTEARSLSQRRAPASHSSYGVETSNGPPPSFTTQRTLSQDRLWKPLPSEKPSLTQKLSARPSSEQLESQSENMGEGSKASEADPSEERLERSTTAERRVDDSNGDLQVDMGAKMADDSTETLCNGAEQATQGLLDVPSADEGSKKSGSDDRKSEDLFLNIAKTDAGGEQALTRSEMRKSRIGTLYASSANRLSSTTGRNDGMMASEQNEPNEGTLSPTTEVPYRSSRRHSLGQRSYAASAAPLEDSSRHRYFGNNTRVHTSGAQSTVGRAERETSPELLYHSNYRGANTDSGPRSFRRSNLSAYRANRNVSTTEAQERTPYADHNAMRVEGTDSTMSTTAPSTVWDELDELKSRIRKIELIGKLPPSSAAAMSTAERPQTATTTMTTMSSSPKQGKATTPPLESAIEGVPATVHPLLHEALRKAQPLLTSDVYQKLEGTASDAMQLASLMGAGLQSGGGSVIGASSSAERQVRRRADSMCRGLTELTIALSAGPKSPPSLQPFRPSSRDASFAQTPPTTSYSVDSSARYGRRFSTPDNSHPPVAFRAQSRLEARRASLLNQSNVNSPQQHASPTVEVHTPSSVHSQSQIPVTSSSRLNRAATRLRSLRAQGAVDGVEDSENEASPSVRPASRARTDVSLRHRSARDRTSLGREYTSSHPLPSFVRKGEDTTLQTPPSVIASSGLPTRRTYASSNVNGGSSNLGSPATPKDNIQPGYRRYASSSGRRDSPAYLSSTEQTPENVTVQRGSASGSRRSLGLTSRLGQVGSFVNGRLRAAKAERERQEGLQNQQQKTPVLRITTQHHDEDQENQTVQQ